MATLEYPITKDTREDWFKIEILEYVPGQFGSSITQASAGKTTDIILLPMPSQLPGTRQGPRWGETRITPLAGLVAGVAGEAADNGFGAGWNQFVGEANALLDRAKSATTIDGLVAAASNAAAKAITNQGLDFQDAISRFAGIRFNENVELTFQGMTIRDAHVFNFTLTPRSREESKRIVDIIRLLKTSMSPPKDAMGISNGVILKVPNVYNISYQRGNAKHPFLNSFKLSALTTLQVEFGGVPYMSYYDGSPVVINLVLAFQELTPIYRNDYEQFEAGQTGVGY